jgi:hypothetical protein
MKGLPFVTKHPPGNLPLFLNHPHVFPCDERPRLTNSIHRIKMNGTKERND